MRLHSNLGPGSTVPVRNLLLGVCLALIASATAAEKSVNPGINKHYENTDFELWVSRFERPGREVFDRRIEIVGALELKEGMHVADIGAGTGLFTRLFAAEVGAAGRVYAVDISPTFIDNIQRIAGEENLKNVVTQLNDVKDVKLPQKSIDLMFVCNTYHHFEYPKSMLASMRRALRDHGSLVVIDFEKLPNKSSPWVIEHVRIGKREVIREIEQAGFQLVGEEPFLETNFFLRFRKIIPVPKHQGAVSKESLDLRSPRSEQAASVPARDR